MKSSKPKSRPCPICQKEAVQENNAAYPFCSDRCKMADLAAWLDGRYRVPGDSAPLPDENHEDNPPS